MKVRVLFFGVLAEEAEIDHLEIEFEGGLFSLKAAIEDRYTSLSRYNYQLSVNRSLVREDLPLNDGDEVAFMPPFAGG